MADLGARVVIADINLDAAENVSDLPKVGG